MVKWFVNFLIFMTVVGTSLYFLFSSPAYYWPLPDKWETAPESIVIAQSPFQGLIMYPNYYAGLFAALVISGIGATYSAYQMDRERNNHQNQEIADGET